MESERSLEPRAGMPAPAAAAGPAAVSWPAAMGAAVRRALLRISADETRVARRGFQVASPALAAHLEAIGGHFVAAYNEAVPATGLAPLVAQLEQVAPEFRGFAYEGAAMGLAVRDALCLGAPLWQRFVDGPAQHQHYICHCGRGWSFARLPGSVGRRAARVPGHLRWLNYDGYGFHEGFFGWRRSIDGCRVPRGLRGYAPRAFDQGLGRSLWFVRGAHPDAIAAAVAAFPAHRQADLWAGVGLAATYAGGVDEPVLQRVLAASGRHAPALAQGACFAAGARHRGGNLVPHTERATFTFCRLPAAEAAGLALGLEPDAAQPDPDGARYEAWRRAIQHRLAA